MSSKVQAAIIRTAVRDQEKGQAKPRTDSRSSTTSSSIMTHSLRFSLTVVLWRMCVVVRDVETTVAF